MTAKQALGLLSAELLEHVAAALALARDMESDRPAFWNGP